MEDPEVESVNGTCRSGTIGKRKEYVLIRTETLASLPYEIRFRSSEIGQQVPIPLSSPLTPPLSLKWNGCVLPPG
jgi:hypothetical protein